MLERILYIDMRRTPTVRFRFAIEFAYTFHFDLEFIRSNSRNSELQSFRVSYISFESLEIP
jgi:hypothetical protein